ncbi:hypothetical protein M758_5G095400 [Ceratodon purpureus]|nr:hypothetical protein M758_5G095400 [Ceratodon purpureus]
MNSATASPRTDAARASPRTNAARASPWTASNLVAPVPLKKVPKLKSIPNVVTPTKFREGKWLECGCPRSTANRAQKVDLTPRQHAHMAVLDESLLHYIFDRQAYLKINELAPQEPHLKQWMIDRCNEGRLFVAKPPTRPPSTEPWRYVSPPKLGRLEPGWRAWDPRDVALTFSPVNTVEEYNEHLETFFLWLNVPRAMKASMMETGEAWMLAAGQETDHLKVNNQRTSKVDRCFVTCDMEFFELLMAKWDRMSFFTRSIKCGAKMNYMKRLMDIRLDPHRSLNSTATRVDPCKGLKVHGHQLCSTHGEWKLRRAVQSAPAPVNTFKLLSPREPPKTRARKLDEDSKPCRGSRWCSWAIVEEPPLCWI